MDAIERVKYELKYNSGPAIPYVKVGTAHAHQLVKMAETSLKQAEEIARLRKALEFYAKSDNYEPWRETDFDRTDAFNFVDLDGGDTAKEALQNGEG